MRQRLMTFGTSLRLPSRLPLEYSGLVSLYLLLGYYSLWQDPAFERHLSVCPGFTSLDIFDNLFTRAALSDELMAVVAPVHRSVGGKLTAPRCSGCRYSV